MSLIVVQDILISDDLIEEKFVCNLQKCKGACCWKGDFGAPLEEDEKTALEELYPSISDLLPHENIERIKELGMYTYYAEPEAWGTTLMDNGACVFMQTDHLGIAYCTIEKAFQDQLINFQKPISCHLYPARVTENLDSGFAAINYDRWDICSPACEKGENLKIPLYRFIKDALIRKYGESFYEDLDNAADYITRK